MPLHLQYRPATLDELYGNDSVKASVKSILDRQDRPGAWLFTGPSGTGKTTMARIVANALGCHERDYEERNIADTRGIDDARKLMANMSYLPQGRFGDGSHGKVRAMVLDECFAKGTMISTPVGQLPIDMAVVGQTVHNLSGTGQVEKIFKNKVPLHRIAKLTFSDGTITFCSIDHQYMTSSGWQNAIDLKKYFLFKRDCSIMDKGGIQYGRNQIMETKNPEGLPLLPKGIYHQRAKQDNLLTFMLTEIPFQARPGLISRGAGLPNMRQFIYLHEDKLQEILFKFMWQQMAKCPTWLYGQVQDQRTCRTMQDEPTQMAGKQPWRISGAHLKNFQKNEGRQPFIKARNYREGQSDQDNQRFIAYLEGNSWWQWNIDCSTGVAGQFPWVGYGGASFAWPKAGWLSNLLQGGYWEPLAEDRDRGGWQWSQWEMEQVARQEERGEIERVGVESVEVYQRGHNDRHFQGIIGDTERDQGYITFYDLQISGHHSYYANNHLVHNCQQATRDFQQAMLKALEDTPAHVVFILCTTDPERLLKTIRTRCSIFEMRPLSGPVMRQMVTDVLTREGCNWPEQTTHAVCQAISDAAEGCPRQALVMLDQVIDLSSEEQMLEAVRRAVASSTSVKELAQALLARGSWAQVAKIISGLPEGEEPEKVRRYILAAAGNALLRRDDQQAATVCEIFKDNFFDSGSAGLVLAAWRSLL